MNTLKVASLVAIVLLGLTMSADRASAANRDGTTGREAVRAVRHDWKKVAVQNVRARQAVSSRLPANFRKLSPEARLAILHARRDLNPARFDRNHTQLGSFLAADDRMRAAQAKDCRPMNGILPDNPHWRYLNFRRNLNPTRFDYYHPTLGALIVENQKIKTAQGCVANELIPPPVVVVPPPGVPSAGPPAGGGPPDVRPVPEPGSMILLALGTLVAIPYSLRRWRRRAALQD